MPGDGRARIGRVGETIASRHLQRLGYDLIQRNYRTREGEIDLIAYADGVIVFCEVKTLVRRTRSSRGPVFPLEAVRHHKQVQVRRMARSWLAERGPSVRYADLRFDAIGLLLTPSGKLLDLEHIAGAF